MHKMKYIIKIYCNLFPKYRVCYKLNLIYPVAHPHNQKLTFSYKREVLIWHKQKY